MIERNEHGVPQYPKGHAGRLFVVLAAIATLERPTAQSVANLTGQPKGRIDDFVGRLRSEYGVKIEKDEAVYRIVFWGSILKADGIKKCLKVPINGTIINP